MRKFSAIALLATVICTASCKKDELKGIDTDALFATPTTQEIESIRATISQRNLTPTDAVVENSYDINSKLMLKMISFRLYGYKQYAYVLLPVTANPLPVQLYINGFGLDKPNSSESIKLSTDTGSFPLVYEAPALRGQSLTWEVNGTSYTTPVSEGTREDAFDGATDDAIATLNAVGALFPGAADTTRVAVRGGSRGAAVTLLMAERDKRVKRAVGVAVPTDLLSSTKTHQGDPTYKFQFLDALINGTATLQQARTKLIASSPLYFCSQLPKAQIHFGENDDITPTTEGDKMVNAMKASGHSDNLEMFVYKDRDHTNIGTDNTEMAERIKAFFSALW
jgi:pimeloyl-ACP methyl ester carboxylesterase